MAINNPALYNAALTGACGGYNQSRVVTSAVQTSYASQVATAKAFAAAVDSLIPTIPSGATAKHVNLLLSICQNTLGGRALTDTLQSAYATIAAAIAAEYREYHDSLLSEPSSVALQLFPLDIPSDIPGYSLLSRTPTFGAEDDDTVTITVADGLTLLDSYITVPGDPDATSIEGIWLLNLWRYVSSTVDPSSLTIRIYSRSLTGVETLVFEVPGNAIGSTAAEYEFLAAPVPTPVPISTTDRLVMKIYASTASAAPVTIHFLHNGLAHSSYASIVD